MRIRAFITHKKAETYADCQDRFAIGKNKIALSDGMTSGTLFPDVWASQLVKEYVSQEEIMMPDLISNCQKKWKEEVNKIFQEKKAAGTNPWRLENMINSKVSACATFCGLKFDDKKWEGIVVGDSAIVEIIDSKIGKIHVTGPLPPNNYPDYLDSINHKIGIDKIEKIDGFIENRTILLVSYPFTDFLYRNKEDNNIIKKILKIECHEDFTALVDEFRNRGMHNDDSTIVIIEFDKEGDDVIDKIDLLIKETIEDEKYNNVEKEENQTEFNANEINNQNKVDTSVPYFSEKQINFILNLIRKKLKIPKKFMSNLIEFIKKNLNCGNEVTDN